MRRTYIFQNNAEVVRESLTGMKNAYPGLYIDVEDKIVMLNRNRKKRVGLICGAGAGIEPFGAGFVGEGMLTAYVFGEVFQSPSVKAIGKAIHNVAMLNQGGILVLLLNYPQQVLNFGLAIEKARLKGITVESFVITDDCSRTEECELLALEKNLSLRSGLTGCSYVFKILGTMSTHGYSLLEILDQAMILNFRLATIGFSISTCTPLEEERRLSVFQIPEGEVVVGCTLQGGKGIRNIKSDSLKGVIREILPKAVDQSGLSDKPCSSCCILVNDLGSMTEMELFATANEVDLFLGEQNICIERMYQGSVMTSLNAKGVLISILNCTDKSQWITFLDECTEAFAWPGCRLSRVNKKIQLMTLQENEEIYPVINCPPGMQLSTEESAVFQKCIIAACEELIKEETIINMLNDITGNGDCGSNMKNFAEYLKCNISNIPTEDVAKTFAMCSAIAEAKMSGSVGPLYSIAFSGAAMRSDCWVSCWEGAIKEIQKITGARVGNRTMLDVLQPAFEMFLEKILKLGEEQWKEALGAALRCGGCWCFKTAHMVPGVGRAKFVPKGRITNMDAGAYGVHVWLTAIYNVLTSDPRNLEELQANQLAPN